MLPVAVARSYSDNAIRHVLPALYMISCFHIMERMDQKQRRRMFQPVRQVAVPAAKSVIADCIFFQALEIYHTYVYACKTTYLKKYKW